MAWGAEVKKAVLALAGAAVVALTGLAPASAAAGRPATAPVPGPVSLAITSVTPATAAPRATVTVSGYVTNTTTDPLTGLSLQLWSSGTAFGSRAQMAAYLGATGATLVDAPVTNAVTAITSLAPHATQRWALTLKPADVGMTAFGVYPLAVQASQYGLALATGRARTFLPYYPGTQPHAAQQKLQVAWVWPLIDTPQQTVCPGLLTDSLAPSIAPAGRLGRLLAAGISQAGSRSQLTWAIDPSLLAGVKTMTQPYRVGDAPDCSGGSARPASATARKWLSQVRVATARSDFFVTPYGDVDVAALSHHGLDSELASAFSNGRATARAILGQPQRPAAPGTGATTTGLAAGTAPSVGGARSQPPLGWIAWPTDGLADYGVLGTLAVNRVGTVLLDGTMMPPSAPPSFTPSGIATTSTGVGTEVNVLLTDDGMNQLLAGAPTAAAPARPATGSPARVSAAAAAFATEQQFLAETAMIAAESPGTQRSIVIAPPRRWNPAPGIAPKLLSETATAPWLQPVSLASLTRGKPGAGEVARRQPPQSRVSRLELGPALLRQVRQLYGQIDLQASILASGRADYLNALNAAVASAESSAWRGSRASRRHARALLGRISSYLTVRQGALQIIDSPVTLGGRSGSVPVSISNRLRQDVTVQLKVSAPSRDRIVIGRFSSAVTVRKHTQKVIKIPVQSAVAGSTTLTIQLYNRSGTPLPGASGKLTVTATHFGTLALVIIGIAFGVFVLTSIGRAVRRGGGRPEPGGTGEETGDTGEPGASAPNPATEPGGPDTVGAEQPDHERAPEEADEHASARGWADPR